MTNSFGKTGVGDGVDVTSTTSVSITILVASTVTNTFSLLDNVGSGLPFAVELVGVAVEGGVLQAFKAIRMRIIAVIDKSLVLRTTVLDVSLFRKVKR
jgi:hypothetical protein